jgi:hypothetical protein
MLFAAVGIIILHPAKHVCSFKKEGSFPGAAVAGKIGESSRLAVFVR